MLDTDTKMNETINESWLVKASIISFSCCLSLISLSITVTY